MSSGGLDSIFGDAMIGSNDHKFNEIYGGSYSQDIKQLIIKTVEPHQIDQAKFALVLLDKEKSNQKIAEASKLDISIIQKLRTGKFLLEL